MVVANSKHCSNCSMHECVNRQQTFFHIGHIYVQHAGFLEDVFATTILTGGGSETCMQVSLPTPVSIVIMLQTHLPEKIFCTHNENLM